MRFLRVILPPIVVFVLVALLVEAFVRWREIPAFRFPLPSAVFTAIVDRHESLLDSLWNTAKAALVGFSLSAIIGIAVAMLLSTSRLVQRAFYPYTVFFQTVPIIAIAPLLVIWFGFGLQAIAVAAFIASVFPVIANTLTGSAWHGPCPARLVQTLRRRPCLNDGETEAARRRCRTSSPACASPRASR